ncbi:MAG: prephenate dehydratase [Promethearchaeota archaeon]
MSEIDNNRKKINDIDDKIIDLLSKRGKLVKIIGDIKKKENIEIFQPEREKEIIDRIKQKSTILKQESIESIWKEIFGACKAIQGSVPKVGYLGPQGTFTHQAALQFFPKAGTRFIPCKNIIRIFENIEKDILEFGVIPIENSLQGTVREPLDLLIDKNLIIYGEIELRIIHHLISLNKSHISKIKTIYSHPQAFAQTSTWIKTKLPTAKLISTNSTAEAVKIIKDLDSENNGAIGTDIVCEIYNLKILESNIEDNPSNFTRFLIISKNENNLKKEKVKTSIVYVVKHVPGALYNVLKLFADANVNLTKIESRPRRKGKWEYIFLMDFEGDKDDPKIQKVLELMNQNVIWYKILGSYPYK